MEKAFVFGLRLDLRRTPGDQSPLWISHPLPPSKIELARSFSFLLAAHTLRVRFDRFIFTIIQDVRPDEMRLGCSGEMRPSKLGNSATTFLENRTRTNVFVPSRRAYAVRTLRPIHVFSTRVVYKFANATISIMPAHSFSPRMRCIRRDGLPPQRPRLFSTFRRDGLRLFSTSRYPPASAWDKLAPSGGMRTTRASHPRRRIIIASNAALIALTNHFYTSRLFFRFVSQIPGIHALISNSSIRSIR